MGKYVDKPGAAMRATVAFGLLNLPLIITALAVYWLGGGTESAWWLRGILAVAVAAAEFAIVVETIGPPMRDWIKSQEYVDDGEKPSWEK